MPSACAASAKPSRPPAALYHAFHVRGLSQAGTIAEECGAGRSNDAMPPIGFDACVADYLQQRRFHRMID